MMNISRLTRNVQVKQFGKRFLNAAKQRPAWMGDTGNMMQYKTSHRTIAIVPWLLIFYYMITWRDRYGFMQGSTYRQFGFMHYPFHKQKHNDLPMYPHSEHYVGRQWYLGGLLGLVALPCD